MTDLSLLSARVNKVGHIVLCLCCCSLFSSSLVALFVLIFFPDIIYFIFDIIIFHIYKISNLFHDWISYSSSTPRVLIMKPELWQFVLLFSFHRKMSNNYLLLLLLIIFGTKFMKQTMHTQRIIFCLYLRTVSKPWTDTVNDHVHTCAIISSCRISSLSHCFSLLSLNYILAHATT